MRCSPLAAPLNQHKIFKKKHALKLSSRRLYTDGSKPKYQILDKHSELPAMLRYQGFDMSAALAPSVPREPLDAPARHGETMLGPWAIWDALQQLS